MDQSVNTTRPYALNPGQAWTYRFGIDFDVKAGETHTGSGAAVVEYVTRKGEAAGSYASD